MVHPSDPFSYALFAKIDLRWIWFTIASFLAGVLNAVAGGGSFLSFPAILGMGVLPVQANATNSVAIWPGQLTALVGYREDLRRNLHTAWPLALAGILGGMGGAFLLLHTPQLTFLRLVPWFMVGAAALFALSGPLTGWLARRNLAEIEDAASGKVHRPHRVALFAVCIVVYVYVGYFGAGAGFLMITTLSLFGYRNMHTINTLKVVANVLANGTACVIFILNGKIVWAYCIAAMIAAAIGGYSSARFAKRVPQPVLRAVVVVLGLTIAGWFFWTNP